MAYEKKDVHAFLVEDFNGEILGVVLKDALIEILGDSGGTPTLEAATNKGYVTVSEETTLFAIAEKMRSRNASIALVTDGSAKAQACKVKGFITRQQIGGAIVEASDFFSE